MKKIMSSSVLFLTIITNVFAHGDNKLGPNGGYLNMPGSFHTELIYNDDGSFQVYLIDSTFKNPMTKDSSVELSLITGNKKIVFQCNVATETYFLCKSAGSKTKSKKGKIEIRAVRNKIKSSVAKYSLPLTLKNQNMEKMSEHEMDKM